MPRVFVSYAHEEPEHDERVLEFANSLLFHGVDATIDAYQVRPPQGWPLWCEEQLRPEVSDFVLMICTRAYLERVENRVAADRGRGAYWEGARIYDYLYGEKGNNRFIPVLLGAAVQDDIPLPVRNHQHYRISAFDLSDPGYNALYRELTAQPKVVKPALGTPLPLPPRTAVIPAPAASGRTLVLPLDSQFQVPADVGELLVSLDEILLDAQQGGGSRITVTLPEVSAAREELAALSAVTTPSLDQRSRIVALKKALQGRILAEPVVDHLLSEVLTMLVVRVAPRLPALNQPARLLECIRETLLIYGSPAPRDGVALDCAIDEAGWTITVDVERQVVEQVAAEEAGGLEFMVWSGASVYVSDFPADVILGRFVPQLVAGYFRLKYWDQLEELPPVSELFNFDRVRVARH